MHRAAYRGARGSTARTARTPRRRKPRRRWPPEVRALLAVCPPTLAGVRNRTLLAFLNRGGLRLGEVLALRRHDLDLESGSVWVLFGKGGYSRTIGIDPRAAAVLAEWVEARSASAVPRPLRGNSDGVPPALLGDVQGVVGLSNKVQLRTMHR